MRLSPTLQRYVLLAFGLLLSLSTALTAQQGLLIPGDENWDINLGSENLNAPISCIAMWGSDIMLGGGIAEGSGQDRRVSLVHRDITVFRTMVQVMGAGAQTRINVLTAGGGRLYVGGFFYATTGNGGMSVRNLMYWNGGVWSSIDNVPNGEITALAVDGNGVVAGGAFTAPSERIARWDGTAWLAMGSGVNDRVNAIAVYEGQIYAGGDFTTADGKTVNHIARWNGAGWEGVGGGFDAEGSVRALFVFDGSLYAGGNFGIAGTATVSNIARWDGSEWHDVGAGTNGPVNALAAEGTRLYAAGNFTRAGADSANYVAMWNGSVWSALGNGVNREVDALATRGGELYAVGGFSRAGGQETRGIARWIVPVSGVAQKDGSASTLAVAPNPIDGNHAEIQIGLLHPAHIRLDLINALGRQVATLAERDVEAGRQSLSIDLRAFPSGFYMLRLDAGPTHATTPLLLAH